MHILVDRDRCESNGLCVKILPSVFEIDDSDELVLLDESPPESFRSQVEEAVRKCPKQALSLAD